VGIGKVLDSFRGDECQFFSYYYSYVWLCRERGQSKTVKEQDFFHVLKGRPLLWLVCFWLASMIRGRGVVRWAPLHFFRL